MNPSPIDPDDALRRKRKWSIWTLLAPLALALVLIMIIGVISSGKKKLDTPKAAKVESASSKAQAKRLKTANIYVVQTGETISAISTRFELTETQLKNCNPGKLTDAYSVRPGMRLHVSQSFCKAREKAAAASIAKLPGTNSTADTSNK